jgi:hypothetical protein
MLIELVYPRVERLWLILNAGEKNLANKQDFNVQQNQTKHSQNH